MRSLRVIKFVGLLFGLMLVVQPVRAIYLNSLIYDIESDKQFLSIPVVNDTSRSNLYTVSAFRIDKPGEGGENRIRGSEMDVIWSPLSITIPAGGKDFFKVFYRGPKDNQERYFRIVFRESPITIIPFRNDEKATDVVPMVTMSAILIVRPRNTNLMHAIDERNGVIKNTGNTFFRVIIQKGCNGDDESSEQFYMLPGESYQSAAVRGENKKFIVALGKYIPLGEMCVNQSSGNADKK